MATLNQPGAEHATSVPSRWMSEEEFVRWRSHDIRAEWVSGQAIIMSPENRRHNSLFSWLLTVIRYYVDKHDLGEVSGESFEARLTAIDQRRVPDIMFVDKSRLGSFHNAYFEGPPDMILEIVSPESAERDWTDKFDAYRKAGVQEYWIIDPEQRRAAVFVLGDGQYRPLDEKDGWLESTVLPGLRLKSSWFWPETRPSLEQAFRELGMLSG